MVLVERPERLDGQRGEPRQVVPNERADEHGSAPFRLRARHPNGKLDARTGKGRRSARSRPGSGGEQALSDGYAKRRSTPWHTTIASRRTTASPGTPRGAARSRAPRRGPPGRHGRDRAAGLPAGRAGRLRAARLPFKSADLESDLEYGHLHGVSQQLPFYQEIEFHPPSTPGGSTRSSSPSSPAPRAWTSS
ncbi:sporulation protein [Streptosporangium sp. NPDC023825]|uniref:sporulation protein n=1 Tax=Streptosporangium sp. NPDC023825 TaxID=3154909 RepID=UPI003428450F